jgi:hypothetical protein
MGKCSLRSTISRTQSVPVRRLGAGHDSKRNDRISNFDIRLDVRMLCSNRNTEFARASLVAIINKIVEFVENLIPLH